MLIVSKGYDKLKTIFFFIPHTKFVENTVGEVVTYVWGKFTLGTW